MTYRVIITDSIYNNVGNYVSHGSRPATFGNHPDLALTSDGLSHDTYDSARVVYDHMRRIIPASEATYDIVHDNGIFTFDEIAAICRRRAESRRPAPATSHDDEDDEDEDEEIPTCDECGEEDEYGDHELYSCEDCGWSCGACECTDCLHYSDEFGGDLCDSCYESWEHDRRAHTPGLSRRRCSADACGSYDVHHDDDREQFVCDHVARQLVNEGRFVTLAYPLPTLEVA